MMSTKPGRGARGGQGAGQTLMTARMRTRLVAAGALLVAGRDGRSHGSGGSGGS